MNPDVVAAEAAGQELIDAIRDLDYEKVQELADGLSDFAAALLIGQTLVLQKILEKRIEKIHGS